MGGAISEIEIDEILVGETGFAGQLLEVGDCFLVEADGDRRL